MSDTIKILFVIDHLKRAGAQQQLVELIRGKETMGLVPEVLCLSSTQVDLVPALESMGVPVHIVHHGGTFSFSTLKQVYRIIRKGGYCLVNTYLFTADLYGRLAGWLARVPVIISSSRSPDLFKNGRQVTVDRLLRHLTDRYIANARVVKEMLVKRERVPARKIDIVYNGVDTGRLAGKQGRELKGGLGLPVDSKTVSIIGRLDREKDIPTFLLAAREVIKYEPSVRFLVVGTGPHEDRLKSLVKELNISKQVIFTGEQTDVRSALGATDILAVASLYEGCSNVILEAMAAGIPVVATRAGGNPELVADQESGFLFDIGDHLGLARLIIRLASESNLRRALGHKAREMIIPDFTIAKLWENTKLVYDKTLQEKGYT